MNAAITDVSGNTLFDVRVRQAILAAQHCVKQVGLLLIDTENIADFNVYNSALADEFVETIWRRARPVLRDPDTVARMENGRLAVLLPSGAGPEDTIFVAGKLSTKLEKPMRVDGAKFNLEPTIGIGLVRAS